MEDYGGAGKLNDCENYRSFLVEDDVIRRVPL